MLAHADQSVHGMLPIWSHYANENWCMIGYHAASVLADANAHDIRGWDLKGLEAAIATATVPHFEGLEDYMSSATFPMTEATHRFPNPGICLRRLVHRTIGPSHRRRLRGSGIHPAC